MTQPKSPRIVVTVRVQDRPGSKVEVSPETVRASEVAKVASEVEAMLESFAQASGVELPGGVPVALVDIEEGSDKLSFSMAAVLVPLLGVLGAAISDQDFDPVPREAYTHLHALSLWGKERRWAIEFEGNAEHGLVGATLEPDAALPPPAPPPVVHGATTVYGRVVRVGGKRTPTARLVPLQGGPDVIVAFEKEGLAKVAARYLYETVGVQGTATWNAETGEISRLVAERLTPLGGAGPDDVFVRLRARVAGRLDGVSAEDLIDDLRDGRGQG